jgi:DNA-nicking Smr family endonuclease
MAREKQLPDEERQLFEEAMQGVRPIEHTNVAPARKPREARDLNASNTAHGDAVAVRQGRSVRKSGVQEAVLRHLRSGRIPIEGQLDLHGHTQPEAKVALEAFIQQSQASDRQLAVRIIHGHTVLLKNEPQSANTATSQFHHFLGKA